MAFRQTDLEKGRALFCWFYIIIVNLLSRSRRIEEEENKIKYLEHLTHSVSAIKRMSRCVIVEVYGSSYHTYSERQT